MKPRLRGHALAETGQRLFFGPRLRGSVPRGYCTRLSPIHGKKNFASTRLRAFGSRATWLHGYPGYTPTRIPAAGNMATRIVGYTSKKHFEVHYQTEWICNEMKNDVNRNKLDARAITYEQS